MDAFTQYKKDLVEEFEHEIRWPRRMSLGAGISSIAASTVTQDLMFLFLGFGALAAFGLIKYSSKKFGHYPLEGFYEPPLDYWTRNNFH